MISKKVLNLESIYLDSITLFKKKIRSSNSILKVMDEQNGYLIISNLKVKYKIAS